MHLLEELSPQQGEPTPPYRPVALGGLWKRVTFSEDKALTTGTAFARSRCWGVNELRKGYCQERRCLFVGKGDVLWFCGIMVLPCFGQMVLVKRKQIDLPNSSLSAIIN